MKQFKKIFALALALALTVSCIPTAFAATADEAVIDYTKDCSLTIYKYDRTFAETNNPNIFGDKYPASGLRDEAFEEMMNSQELPNASTEQTLGNGQTSIGYAIKGVEFTIAKIGLPMHVTETIDNGTNKVAKTQLVYEFSKMVASDFLHAIGLYQGVDSYEFAETDADIDTDTNWYYTSDVLIDALAKSLEENSTNVKNELEAYMTHVDSKAMPLTNEYGRTTLEGLDVGLYLVVETKVPEMVTNTTNPFLVSLPMTTVHNNSTNSGPEGGHAWNYNVTVYPKNETGIPALEKTVRESVADTGKNGGSDTITDGYAHTATGSAGDVMQYQIISTLPTVTSYATMLSTYNFFDTIAPSLTYNDDVKIEFFKDKDCTDKVATWTPEDGKFTVSYSDDGLSMTIDMTMMGLSEMCFSEGNANGDIYGGYSNYAMRITYSATIDSTTDLVCGEDANCNKVVLTWKRTSSEYYDTLVDDCHVYSFGINLGKLFSDATAEDAHADGKYEHVKFVVYNETDGYWINAELNAAEGIYYVTGRAADEADAAIFTPVQSGSEFGKVIIRGLEDDQYRIVEIETCDGYTLLESDILVDFNVVESSVYCDIYSEDVLGLLQNDPRYSFDAGNGMQLSNTPQKGLSHKLLTVSAKVFDNSVDMGADGSSVNAEALMSVVNNRGFDLPQTGDQGVWMYGVGGSVLMLGAVLVVLFAFKKKDNQEAALQQ